MIGREQVGGPSVVSRLVRVGLPPIDAFGHGWVQALVPLLMTVRQAGRRTLPPTH